MVAVRQWAESKLLSLTRLVFFTLSK
uniref:Uncharacterized protein n=1 Tax=Anguilla anguilla TaxID=7936 RepID=A0A0E9QU47_ANGAN